MNAATLASRAVLAAYAKKALRPVEIGAILVLAIALLGTSYLIANVSAWWWLLMIVVIAYGVIGSLLWLILHFTIDKLEPPQTKTQKVAVAQFIEKTEKIADMIGVTRFGLLLRIMRDVMGRNDTNVLAEFARDSKDLKTSFEQVIQAFR